MKSKKRCILFLILVIITASTSAQQKLLIGGSGWDKVAIIDKTTGKIEWSHQLDEGAECNDAEITHEGNILIAYKKGAKLITKNQKIIWDFKAKPGQELFTATQLSNGDYFLAACAYPARFITLNKKGEKIEEQNYDLKTERVHAQFRQVTPTQNNTIIIPALGKGEVIEIDKNNQILKRIKVGGNPFSVNILPDKNWLVSCGDAHKFVIIDPETEKIIQIISDTNVAEYALNFVAEIRLLENGNYLLANWNGHAKDKSQPKIIELDRDNKVVWTLPYNPQIKNISTIDVIKE